MDQIILSILTPAIFERLSRLKTLSDEIGHQINDQPVEHLAFLDNCKRSVGRKRDALLRIARGKYVAFVDDDDSISGDYVREILIAAQQNPDVITFQQGCVVSGELGTVEFRLGNPDEQFKPGDVTKRNAWHVCAWRTALAICSGFPDSNYGEDKIYSAPLCAMPDLKEVHIPKILHYYTYDAAVSRAQL